MTVKEETLEFKGKYYAAIGKRKNAVAKVRLYPKGKGRFYVNEKEISVYFPRQELLLNVKKPLVLLDKSEQYDISVKVSGGGFKGQTDAICLGIARAMVDMDKDIRPILKKSNLLTRDSRKKERKKPGLKKARRAPQWQKR
jgi:small subunit ribosomal protein S9